MWTEIIRWVALAVLSYALRPTGGNEQPKPATLEDFDVPMANEGQEIAVLFGTRDISNPNVTWYGDLKVRAIKKRGGKK